MRSSASMRTWASTASSSTRKMTVNITKPKAQWVLSTNSGAKQIWIAALTKSWKLDEDGKGGFVLKDSGQSLKEVVESPPRAALRQEGRALTCGSRASAPS